MTVVRETPYVDCDQGEAENADDDREQMQRFGCRVVSEDETDHCSREPGAYEARRLKEAACGPHLVRAGNACEIELQSEIVEGVRYAEDRDHGRQRTRGRLVPDDEQKQGTHEKAPASEHQHPPNAPSG